VYNVFTFPLLFRQYLTMKLNKDQKKAVISWIAEGLQSNEVNDRAAVFKQPFSVSKQQVDYYRKTRASQMAVLKKEHEGDAINTGLALMAVRVQKLQRLAGLLENDLFEKRLVWLEDKKGIGTMGEVYDFFKFNKAEVDAYRGVLDDIAKEVGDRVHKIAPTDPTGKIEYAADARSAVVSKLLQGVAFGDKED